MNQSLLAAYGNPIERVNAALTALRQGKGVLVVDDEDRENEGDLLMAATMVRPEDINHLFDHKKP